MTVTVVTVMTLLSLVALPPVHVSRNNVGFLLPDSELSINGIMLFMLLYIFFHSYILLCGALAHSFQSLRNILLYLHPLQCMDLPYR